MFSSKFLLSICILAFIGIAIILLNNRVSSPTIVYVRSHDLVYGYDGMISSQQEFEIRRSKYKAQIDSLNLRFQQLSQSTELSLKFDQNKALINSYIQDEYNSLIAEIEEIQDKMQIEEQDLLEGALFQVNKFCEEYAIEQGYDLVLGTTLSGSILYGNPEFDCTDEFLIAINKMYNSN